MFEKVARQAQNRIADSDMQPGANETLRKQLGHLGATGEHPQGKISPHDEGGLRFATTAHEGNVIVDFGTPVRSVGMDPDAAQSFGISLLNYAKEAKKQRREMRRENDQNR